jgi:peroxiredoxin
LSDWDEQVGVAYETRAPGTEKVKFAKRLSYLIDPDGVIAKSYEVGDVGAHPAEVLRDLRALQSQRG